MTGKANRAQYTLEFKLEAVRLVKAGQPSKSFGLTLAVSCFSGLGMYRRRRSDACIWQRNCPKHCLSWFGRTPPP
jgi:hypothetical protein